MVSREVAPPVFDETPPAEEPHDSEIELTDIPVKKYTVNGNDLQGTYQRAPKRLEVANLLKDRLLDNNEPLARSTRSAKLGAVLQAAYFAAMRMEVIVCTVLRRSKLEENLT